MKLAFYCNYLNHHQVCIADALYELLGGDFVFVATLPRNEKELKGGEDYSTRPYCLLAAETEEGHQTALELSRSAEVCVFGACSQEYAVERAKQKDCGLAFELGERWLKHGWLSVGSSTFRTWLKNYFFYYRNVNYHKLCCSAFAAKDEEKLHAYIGRHYKWGYFIRVPESLPESAFEVNENLIRIMWCARFLKLKHPELPVKMANKIRNKGYSFIIDYYGSGEEEHRTKKLVEELGLNNIIKFHGNNVNPVIIEAMKNHDILLFTSNRYEGWGVVINEAMSNGCAVVASNNIGSVPYLVDEGTSGLSFEDGNVDSLTEKVEWLMNHPEELKKMKRNSFNIMKTLWNPKHAAINFLQLIEDIQHRRICSIETGPCSKA